MIKLILGAILVLQPGSWFLSGRVGSVWKVSSFIAELAGLFLIWSYSPPTAVLLFVASVIAHFRLRAIVDSAHDVVWNRRHGEEPWPNDVLKLSNFPVMFYVTGLVEEGEWQLKAGELVEKAKREQRGL